MKDLRCQVCLQEAMAAEWPPNTPCKHCGTYLIPQRIAHDVYVKLNWQQLRQLCIYATRWGADLDMDRKGNHDALQALLNIVRNLEQFRPNGAPKLTITTYEAPSQAVPITRIPELKLTPDAQGNIISPFYRRGLPPLEPG